MARVSVHVISEHAGDHRPFGCSYIRNILPLGHPRLHDRVALTHSTAYTPADVVIVERAWRPAPKLAELDDFLARARADGVHLVHTLDDNLLDSPHLSLASRTVVRTLCREAAGVIVATTSLQERVRRLNPRVLVVPNALDERLFFSDLEIPRPALSGPVVIGFMGTFTHDWDLMLVVQPLREVLRRHQGAVELEIVGGVADRSVLALFEGLPLRVLAVPAEAVAYPPFVPWMRRTARWDIAIAPLESSAINLAKSDIKHLDYGALGVAGIYSAVPAYAGTVRHGETGMLVDDAPASWAQALELLIDDEGLRAMIATNARDYVRSERTLERCAPAWLAAIDAILGHSEPANGVRTIT